jgi:DASS family divalent anion:Na+ symporter
MKVVAARVATAALALGIWFTPLPRARPQAWRLFAIFVAAIFSVVVNAFPILTSSVLAVAAAVFTGILSPEAAYTGFANGTILLIVVASWWRARS